MPIIDLGYRPWEGQRITTQWRWLAIVSTGISLCWRQYWPRRLLTFGWMPAFFVMFGMFFQEHTISDREARFGLSRVVAQRFDNLPLAELIESDPRSARAGLWAYLLLAYFRYPQALLMIVLFGMVAPRLISFDLRSRSYLIYFSRPISVVQYILGKAGVLWFLIFMLVTLPSLVVYVFGLFLSEDTGALFQTWHLPLRMMLASVFLALPTSAVALALSSWTTESRFASFIWYAIWIFGWVTYGILTSRALLVSQATPSWFPLLSPYHTLGLLQTYAFGLNTANDPIRSAAVLITLVTLGGFAITYRQITKQLSV